MKHSFFLFCRHANTRRAMLFATFLFIYLFMYPFLSHELVFIIGCIYVVKLCGKVTALIVQLIAILECLFFFSSRTVANHPVCLHCIVQTDNLKLSFSSYGCVYGKFLAFVTAIKCSKGIFEFFGSTKGFFLSFVRYGEKIRCNEHTMCTCIEFNT